MIKEIYNDLIMEYNGIFGSFVWSKYWIKKRGRVERDLIVEFL